MVRMLQIHNERFDAFALVLGRIGFFARGFVWASVGAIAITAAFTGQKTQGTQGAIELIANNPGGIVFLLLVTIGLLCYASWRFIEGLYGMQIKPDQPPFIQVVRGIITPFASCIAYCVFAVTNLDSIAKGIENSQGGGNFTAKLTKYTSGKVLLCIIAFFLFVTSIMWIVDLIKAKLFQDLDLKKLNKFVIIKVLVVTFAYLGTFGRAILFALLSVEFWRIVFDDEIQGGGFGVALQQLQYNTTARIFLVLFGWLVFLFGCFSICQGIFKKFYRYKPHFSKSKHSDKAEAVFKSTFSKSVTKEQRYEQELDQSDENRKKNEAMEQTHPDLKKQRLDQEEHAMNHHNRQMNQDLGIPDAPPTPTPEDRKEPPTN